MTLHQITEFYTKWFSLRTNVPLNVRTIVIFKSFVKEINDWNKAVKYVHDNLLYQTYFF
jgi:hypothetical protein